MKINGINNSPQYLSREQDNLRRGVFENPECGNELENKGSHYPDSDSFGGKWNVRFYLASVTQK